MAIHFDKWLLKRAYCLHRSTISWRIYYEQKLLNMIQIQSLVTEDTCHLKYWFKNAERIDSLIRDQN